MTITVPLCIAIVVGSAACKSSKVPAPPPAPPTAVPTDAAVPDAAVVPVVVAPIDIKARVAELFAKLSPEQADAARTYAKLLGPLADCKPTSFGDFDGNCPASKTEWAERTKHTGDATWLPVERAAWWMHADTTSSMLRKVLAERAAGENGDPDLLAVLIVAETKRVEGLLSIVYNGYNASSPALVQALIARGTFPDQGARRMAMWALAKMSPRPPGVHETLVKTIDTDSDPYVRQETCKATGFVADDAMLAVYDRLLVPATDPELYDSCFSGLMWMWWPVQNASEKAYARSVALIAKGRHDTEMTEAWGDLEGYAESLERGDAPPKPWAKLPELRSALVAFITDTKGNQVGRAGAVEALRQLKASSAELRTLRAKLPKEEPWAGPTEGGGHASFLDDLVQGCVDAAIAGQSCERTVQEAAHEVWKVGRPPGDR